MSHSKPMPYYGPVTADQLHEDDHYELSQGHPVYCAPAGSDHGGSNTLGASVIDSDPDIDMDRC
ncbi:MAG: hypothetical protein ACR2HF_10980 [Methylococcaceae bacterium]